MAISIDWANQIIFIPKADMIPIDAGPPEIVQLDMEWLRTQINSAMASQEGMAHPTMISHNVPVTVSGAILARVILFINGWRVEFEDGQYRVNVVGANTDLGERSVVNQVGISTSNSAGLQDLNSLQAASFDGAVALNVNSPFSGITFPVGTRAFPVNNIADALAIATERGINTFAVMSSMTFGSGDFSNGFKFVGDNTSAVEVTLLPGTNVTNCEFYHMHIEGTLDGDNQVRDCHVHNLNYVQGFIRECALAGTITIGDGVQASILDCWSDIAGGGHGQVVNVDMGGGGSLALRNFTGGMKVDNFNGDGEASLDFLSGRVEFGYGCTGGDIYVRGIASVRDNHTHATNCTVHDLTVTAQQALTRKVLTNLKTTDPDTGVMTVWDDKRVITQITRTGSTVRVDVPGHDYEVGDDVWIFDADQPEYNGQHTITARAWNYYEFTIAGTPLSPATGTPFFTNPLLTAAIYEDIAKVQTYRGQKIELQDWLL